MKIGMKERFWVVVDPGPQSTLADCCHESGLKDLELQFRGGLTCEENLALFTDSGEAEAEARTRLLARDTAKALAAGAEALQGAATVQIVGEDGEVVFSAAIPRLRG